jgi:hypothetical protein
VDKDKLEKLKKLMELANRNTVSPQELIEVVTALVTIVKKENLATDNSISQFKAQLEGFISRERQFTQSERNSLSDAFSALKKDITGTLGKYANELSAKITNIQEIDLSGIESDIETLKSKKDIKLDTAEQIKTKLETLEKDARLDASAIKGLDKFSTEEKQKKLDFALGVLDQRTQFLINKSSTYTLPTASASTLGGVKIGDRLTITDGVLSADVQAGSGAVDSVNGQTGVVVLDTGDITEATDANYVSDAQLVVIGNTSGANTGDNATNTQYSGLATSKLNVDQSSPQTTVGTLTFPKLQAYDATAGTGVSQLIVRTGAGQSTAAQISIQDTAGATVFGSVYSSTAVTTYANFRTDTGGNLVLNSKDGASLFLQRDVEDNIYLQGLTKLGSAIRVMWANTTDPFNSTFDIGISRTSAGILEVNNGTAGTLETLAVDTLELGHATDTTFHRESAGVVTIEGRTIGLVVTKTDTGDGTGSEGLFQINTFDNTFKIYADGAWRSLTTW